MTTLNPDLLDTTSLVVLNRAGDIMRQIGKNVLTPEVVLLALLRIPESTAYRAIARLTEPRGFKPQDLEKETDAPGAQRRSELQQ